MHLWCAGGLEVSAVGRAGRRHLL